MAVILEGEIPPGLIRGGASCFARPATYDNECGMAPLRETVSEDARFLEANMRSILCLGVLIATGCAVPQPESPRLGLEVSPTREAVSLDSQQRGSTKINWRQKKYARGAREILSHTSTDSDGDGTFDLHCYAIYPTAAKRGRVALVVWVENGRISRLHNGPALAGLDFLVDDLTGDGVPDYVCIMGHGNGKIIEAFTLIDGIMEPVPDDVLAKINSKGFYYDEAIPKLIRKKTEQGN